MILGLFFWAHFWLIRYIVYRFLNTSNWLVVEITLHVKENNWSSSNSLNFVLSDLMPPLFNPEFFSCVSGDLQQIYFCFTACLFCFEIAMELSSKQTGGILHIEDFCPAFWALHFLVAWWFTIHVFFILEQVWSFLK